MFLVKSMNILYSNFENNQLRGVKYSLLLQLDLFESLQEALVCALALLCFSVVRHLVKKLENTRLIT